MTAVHEPPPRSDNSQPAQPFGGNGERICRQAPVAAPSHSRLLPHDMEAERAVLGAMLLDATALTEGLSRLTADAFAVPQHRTVFGTLAAMREDGIPVDLVTMKHRLAEDKNLVVVGDVDELVQLAESVPSVANVAFYADILTKLQRQRELFMIGRELQAAATISTADPEAIAEQFRNALSEHKTTLDPLTPQYIPAVEMIQRNPELREPIIEGLLRRGEVMNVIAPPKLRKSWMVLNLLLSVASGRDWLHFPTCPGRCLLIDNELHPQTLAKRIPRVMQVMGLELEDIADRLFVESLRGRLCDIYGMGGYFNAIKPGTFDLIVLDAWYRFQPKGEDENSNAAICAAYNQLDRYAAQLACAFVVIHHASKGVQTGKAVTDVGAGAGAQARAADTHLILREHTTPNAVVLEAAVRSWAPVEPISLRWEFPIWMTAPDLDPTDLKKQNSSRRRRDQSRTEAKPEPPWTADRFATEILTAEPMTKAATLGRATEAGLKESRAKQLLAMAESAGLAHRIEKPRDNRAWYANSLEPTLQGSMCVCEKPPTPPRDANRRPGVAGVATQIETVSGRGGMR